MSKRKIILISVALAAIVLALFIGFIASGFVQNNQAVPTETPNPTASSSVEPTAVPLPTAEPTFGGSDGYDLSAFLGSEQYQQGITSPMGEFTEQVDTGTLDAAIAPLAISTMERYVQNAVANPYFVSNFWAEKDNNRADSLQVYLTELMSDELATTFLQPASEPGTEAFRNYYNGRIHLLSEGLTPAVSCQETFGDEACFYEPYQVQDFSLSPVEGSDSEMQGTLVVTTQPIYQKPDSLEGDTVYEDRTYTFNFTLRLNDEPSTGKLDEKPIMELTALEGSLVTGQVTDYQVLNISGE